MYVIKTCWYFVLPISRMDGSLKQKFALREYIPVTFFEQIIVTLIFCQDLTVAFILRK